MRVSIIPNTAGVKCSGSYFNSNFKKKGGLTNDKFIKFNSALRNKFNTKLNKLKEEQKMKFYLKIFFLLAILITITFKILIGMESEKSTQDQEKTKTSSIGLPLKAEDTGISRLPKMSTTTFGMFDNSCSILQ